MHHLIVAEGWGEDEYVCFTIHFIKILKNVIEMFAVHSLVFFFPMILSSLLKSQSRCIEKDCWLTQGKYFSNLRSGW